MAFECGRFSGHFVTIGTNGVAVLSTEGPESKNVQFIVHVKVSEALHGGCQKEHSSYCLLQRFKGPYSGVIRSPFNAEKPSVVVSFN